MAAAAEDGIGHFAADVAPGSEPGGGGGAEEDAQGLDPEARAVRQTEEQQRQLFGGLLAHEYYQQHRVRRHAKFFRNSRGMRLYTQIWEPASSSPKALICCCHGFGNDTSWTFQLTCVQFAEAGYAVCALDFEGHGRSDGLKCAIRKMDTIVDDGIDYFTSVRKQMEYQGIPCFLFGESMGAAIALLIAAKSEPSAIGQAAPMPGQPATPSLQWAGLILACPMLRIGDKMRPHWLVASLLMALAYFMPDAPLVPSAPASARISCKDPIRRELAFSNPCRYEGNPRLQSATELLRATDQVTELLPRVSLPFLVIHGEADPVTDCESSKAFFIQAQSSDKTIHLYPGALHQLLQGELPEDREKIWHDVLSWLLARTGGSSQK